MSTHVCFDTSYGRIVAEIFTERAPLTGHNFLRYTDEGLYQNAMFYRATRRDNERGRRPIQIIQGGLGPEYEDAPLLPPIPHESTQLTRLSHLDGALSMARWAPGTASSEFFVVLGDTPELDYGGTLNPDRQGFAVFGQVVAGLEVVRAINAGPTGTLSNIAFMKDQTLIPAVAVRIARLRNR